MHFRIVFYSLTQTPINIVTQAHSSDFTVYLHFQLLNDSSFSSRSSRLTEKLASMSKDQIKATLNPERIFPESTKKKWRWVLRLYEEYYTAAEANGFPITAGVVNGFVSMLIRECSYAPESIRCVVLPCLKHLNREVTGTEVNSSEWKSILIFAAQIIKTHPRESSSDGKDPAFYSDVIRIIDHMPSVYCDKAREAAAYLLSLYTGARAITISSMTLSDIVRVVKSEGKENLLIQMRFNVTKGNRNWGHVVTLSGSPKEEKTENVVYWLEKYLNDVKKVSLVQRESWDIKGREKESLFLLSPDCLRERFKRAAAFTGYPPLLLAYHSLRSGFLCSALIEAWDDEDKKKAVLENTAIVAGWAPLQRAQMRYVKDCAKRTIVANRLVTKETESPPVLMEEPLDAEFTEQPKTKVLPVIDSRLTTPEELHRCTLHPCSWPHRELIDSLKRIVVRPFLHYVADEWMSQQVDRCWKRALARYVSQNREWEKMARKSYRLLPAFHVPRNKSACISRVRRFVGSRLLGEKLGRPECNVAELIDDLQGLLQDDTRIRQPIRRMKKVTTKHSASSAAPQIDPDSAEASSSSTSRFPLMDHAVKPSDHMQRLFQPPKTTRRAWTAEDNATLIKLVNDQLTWKEIGVTLNRKPGNCLSHYDVLAEKGVVKHRGSSQRFRLILINFLNILFLEHKRRRTLADLHPVAMKVTDTSTTDSDAIITGSASSDMEDETETSCSVIYCPTGASSDEWTPIERGKKRRRI